jgi:hypothetical protein
VKWLRALGGVLIGALLLVGCIVVFFGGLMVVLALTVLLTLLWKPLAVVFALGAGGWWSWQSLQFLERLGEDEADPTTRRW